MAVNCWHPQLIFFSPKKQKKNLWKMAFEIQNYQSKYHQDINKMFESGVLECGYNTARGRFPFPF